MCPATRGACFVTALLPAPLQSTPSSGSGGAAVVAVGTALVGLGTTILLSTDTGTVEVRPQRPVMRTPLACVRSRHCSPSDFR